MNKSAREVELESRILELESELAALRQGRPFHTSGDTVTVPEPMKPVFDSAQATVARYFSDLTTDPTQATISISGDRYVLVRASSLSVEFLQTIKNLYADHGDERAFQIGRNFLFDISHVIGKEDALTFHRKMNVTDPIAKLSAGPVLFAYCGWAFVDISPESTPQPNDDYFIKYDHPYSFEADAWIQAGQRSDDPVCIMNCGYSSGWCEASFGLPLTSVEISCRAAGDDRCTFIMAPPHRIQEHLDQYLPSGRRSDGSGYNIPTFFERKRVDEEMRAARRKAEESDRMKSEFLANMSHEIRTPMNAIIGMTELVLDTELNASQHEYLRMVAESAESLLSIINQILDFSKIESGKVDLEEIAFDLREEMGDTLKSLGLRAHNRGVELIWRVADDVPCEVIGDPVRLRQMVINLVGNAIKFTSDGEIEVAVTSKPANASREVHLHFSVRDTGMGIPPDKLALIFSAFQQVDSSTTRLFGGTGLGLAITSQLAQAMGGKTWVESELGTGSTFHFTVRLKPGGTTPRHDSDPLPAVSQVMIVEDNATALRSLREMIESWGLTPQVCRNATEAQSAFGEWVCEPDRIPVLICDRTLPDQDAFDVIRAFRSTVGPAKSLTILLASAAQPEDVRQAQELKVDAVLMKPVKPSELLDAICAGADGGLRQASSSSGDQPACSSTDLPALRILVAEDGIANQKMAKGLLEKWGHHVHIVENGQQAIERLEQESFDVVLMDVQMPIMDGLDATRAIRQSSTPTVREIPIIAMTARAMKGDREKCLEAGMDDYVSKPIRRQELEQALRRQIRPPTDRT